MTRPAAARYPVGMEPGRIEAIAAQRALPISVERYHQMIDAGVLSEKDRVELIEGVIVAVSPQSPEHLYAVTALVRLLNRALGDEWAVRPQGPLTLARSEPEPDVAVVRRVEELAAAPQHPGTAALVVEVARSSLALDRAMAPIYAEAGVNEYWIVDVAARVIEVHRDPADRAYRATFTAVVGETLRPAAFPAVEVPVAALFRDAAH